MTLHINLHLLYVRVSSGQVQKSKNYENPRSTSKVTTKTILLFFLNCFLFVISFEFKVTFEVQLI